MEPHEREQHETDVPNPYKASAVDATANPIPQEPDPVMITKFRQQIHALGGFWIIIGGIAVAIVGLAGSRIVSVVEQGPQQAILIGIVVFTGVVGVAWIVLGVFACLKRLWAVYVGLVLSYISVGIQLLNTNPCAIVILVVVILQAHRVIGWAKKMQTAGVPLTTKL